MTTVLEMPKFQKDRESDPDNNEFLELVYDRDAAPIIFKHFPNAYFSDASDEIHEGRFQVILQKNDKDKFYTLMMLEGFAQSCLCLMLQINLNENVEQIRGWLNSAKKLKAAGYIPTS